MRKLHRNILLLILPLLCTAGLTTQAQTVQVQGVVYDKTNNNSPFAGVSVVIYSADNKQVAGGSTNAQGRFTVNAPVGATIRFSILGYETSSHKVTAAKTDLKIYLSESINELETAVIVGYQTKRLTDVTSAVTVVKVDDLTITPVANAMELLQGQVAGLNIQINSGMPGSTGTYSIRGISDISISGDMLASSSPLIVVDGVPQDDASEFDAQGLIAGTGISPLTSIPIEDIDNFQILKDAAATSLYGSKGAYGVILINTKRGNSPTPQIEFTASAKVNAVPLFKQVLAGAAERNQRIAAIMAGDTAAMYTGIRLINSNPFLADSLNAYFNNNTDWQDLYFNPTFSQEYNLRVSGGQEQFNYKVNANYLNEPGIIKNTGFNRYALRSGIGYSTPNKKFSLAADVNATFGTNDTGSGNLVAQETVGASRNLSSLLPPPSLYSASSEALSALSIENQKNSLEYNSTVNATYRPIQKLTLSGTFGYTFGSSERERFTPGILSGNNAIILNESSSSNKIYGRASASYNTNLWIFKMGLTLGAEIDRRKSYGTSVKRVGLANDYIHGPIGSSPNQNSGETSVSDQATTVAFTIAPSFGIRSLNMSGDKSESGIDKYVISPSIRPEINSAYGTRTRWAFNPGLGVRWNFSLEPFMRNIEILSLGSLRASWGRTTKYVATIYDIWGTYLVGTDTYNGQQIIPVDFSAKLPNVDLKPVTNTSWNVGLDLKFWNGLLDFTTDAYYKQIDNQLSDMNLADHNGFTKTRSTETSIVNYGIEFAIRGTPLPKKSPLSFTAQITMAINRDVITKLPGGVRQIITTSNGNYYVHKVGDNALSSFMFVTQGVYARDEDVPVDPATGKRLRVGGNETQERFFKAGDPIWVDLNGDYIIDDNDRVIVGNSQPRFTGGFNFNIRYKSLSLSSSWSYIMRRDIVNQVLADNFASYANPSPSYTSARAVVPISSYNFWTPDNREAVYPNPFDFTRSSIIDPFRSQQTLYLEDGSYLKINSITLSYSLGENLVKSLGVSGVRFEAGVSNVYTFSNYSGVNPETVNSLGYDNSSGYPRPRSFSLRVNVRF